MYIYTFYSTDSFTKDEIGVLVLQFSFLELYIVGELYNGEAKIYVYGQPTDVV